MCGRDSLSIILQYTVSYKNSRAAACVPMIWSKGSMSGGLLYV